MKRLVGIAVASGTPIRVACKDVRRRMRNEARRQKELDEGVEPEVVLDSFLNQLKVEQQQQSCQTSSCEEQEVASDSVLVDCQRQGVSPRRSVELQAHGE